MAPDDIMCVDDVILFITEPHALSPAGRTTWRSRRSHLMLLMPHASPSTIENNLLTLRWNLFKLHPGCDPDIAAKIVFLYDQAITQLLG